MKLPNGRLDAGTTHQGQNPGDGLPEAEISGRRRLCRRRGIGYGHDILAKFFVTQSITWLNVIESITWNDITWNDITWNGITWKSGDTP